MVLSDFIEKDKTTDYDALITKVWQSDASVEEKVSLSLEIYALEPTYSVLTNLWMYYKISNQMSDEINQVIFKKYQDELSDPNKELSGTTEYSLYYDLFEDPTLARDLHTTKP